MRIVQLIDSLEAGGAERMAVTYANALSNTIEFSGLAVTRVEGSLKNDLKNNVFYSFLNRKMVIDLQALIKFRRYLIDNKINVIHAHSTSIYFAFLVKVFYPKIKIIWHDHYGNSELLRYRRSKILKIISYTMHGIISVNKDLKIWAQQNLHCKDVIYLENFTTFKNEKPISETRLEGDDGKRILCLANLRPQKNHQFLVQIAEIITKTYPDWTFHLVGKDFDDNYSEELKKLIVLKSLQNHVYLYGSRSDVFSIINKVEIGILTSQSEGLPVSLLEYGIGSLPVICTDVGEISSIIQNTKNGILVDSNDVTQFVDALQKLISNKHTRISYGQKLYEKIYNDYAEIPIIKKYISWINEK